jgi:hypothetical protein
MATNKMLNKFISHNFVGFLAKHLFIIAVGMIEAF